MSIRFAAGLVFLLLAHATPAGAATFTVNSTADAPDADVTDRACATSAPPACTLRAAVQQANDLVARGSDPVNVIDVPAGTYTLTIVGRNEDDAASGDLDVRGGALHVRGAGTGSTTIDGNQLDRLFHLFALGPGATGRFSLAGVTVRNGNAVSSPPNPASAGPDVGGAIRIEQNAGLEVNDAIFEQNQAGARGGAIGMPPGAAAGARTRYHELGADPAINTKLTNVTMRDNSAGVEGGAMFNNRDAFLTKVLIEDNTVTGDPGGFERGGGIAQSGDLSLTDVIISGNSIVGGNPSRAPNGGGIANRGDPCASPFPISGRISLQRVTVSDNQLQGLGGGIGSGDGAEAILTNTTISGNRASNGAGLANAGSAELTNVTLTGNPASAGGGVVTVRLPPLRAGCPATPNPATTLRSTILNGVQGGGPNCFMPPPPAPAGPFRLPVSAGDNISSDGSCNLTGPGDSNGTDPLLGPLADNGGFTPTHALLDGSPALDRVLSNTCPPPATDQRDVARPQGARCDIGAYERAVAATVPPSDSGTFAPFAGCPPLTVNVIRASAASERITGTVRGDRIFAGTGNDVVDALAGDDCVDFGTGNDVGQGGLGADLMLAGLGNDRIEGSSGNDRLRGGPGRDSVDGGFGNDVLHGQAGKDRLSGSRGRDRVNGGSGRDVVSAGSGNDRVAGDQGNDRIHGNSGNDLLRGNSGGDRLTGGAGADRVSGGDGGDRINSRDGRRDRVNCGRGRDRVIADRIDRIARNCERVRRR